MERATNNRRIEVDGIEGAPGRFDGAVTILVFKYSPDFANVLGDIGKTIFRGATALAVVACSLGATFFPCSVKKR